MHAAVASRLLLFGSAMIRIIRLMMPSRYSGLIGHRCSSAFCIMRVSRIVPVMSWLVLQQHLIPDRLGDGFHHQRRNAVAETLPLLRVGSRENEVVGERADPL